MYLDFYGLRENPFNLTPDSHFLFLSDKHREAMAHIRYGIENKKGFILISGEIGAGKTTLCRSLLKDLEKSHKVALVLHPTVSPSGILRAIIKDLGVSAKARSTHDMIDILYSFLLETKNVVLLIDEAQNLSVSALEQIRLLGNLETEKEKLIQIVLVGQPELKDILTKPSLKQLNQRISVRYHLYPLSREETCQYIGHRLQKSGEIGNLEFSGDALQLIYNYSGGIPRLINIICEYCLLAGFVKNTFLIDKDVVQHAVKEMQGGTILNMDKTDQVYEDIKLQTEPQITRIKAI